MTINATKPKPEDRPAGWIIQCPKCGHAWKISRPEIADGRWILCPSCLDRESQERGR